jgi:outer membrane protein OmpA-like peptidoglycan-associated protein
VDTLLDQLSDSAFAEGGAQPGVTIVRVDGEPAPACVVWLDTAAANGPARAQAKANFKSGVRVRVGEVRAANPDADLLKALDVASRAAGQGGTVVLIDSGLQTKAPLDFTSPGLLDADTGYLVDYLRRSGFLPDLRGRAVLLAGIGVPAPPQAPLDLPRQRHLTDIWTAIAQAAGASSVAVVGTATDQAPAAGLPSVRLVAVPDVEVIPLACNAQSILSDDGTVGFHPDSTDFRDPAAARNTLRPFAQWLGRTTGASARLVGSIAHYGDPHNPLALHRAQKVRDVLVDLGADGNRITAEGAGWGPIPDPTAAPDPAIDQLNRRVVVTVSCT